ncbi:MAG: putative porin, partial [Bacteroidaceae bacterium]|nr:putative porin [Bacteroidaceae bacterium]
NPMDEEGRSGNNRTDSLNQEIDVNTIPVELRMWRVDQRYGMKKAMEVDTIFHHFQNSNLPGGLDGEYNYLGNLGSPRKSRLFFNRTGRTQFIFLNPLSQFVKDVDQIMYVNTKSPFTNITYNSAGSKTDGEERFKAIFAVNVNKKLGVGFVFDYLYGRGLYESQSTALFNTTFFTSYTSDHYDLHATFNYNKLKIAENGGIENDLYITDPIGISEGKKSYLPSDIPTRLGDTWNATKGFDFFLTHRYNLGVKKETVVQNKEGEESKEQLFVPITSFIHTFKLSRYDKTLISYDPANSFFANNYLPGDSTSFTKYVSLKNTFAITTHEGFSKWAKAALSAFITHEARSFSLIDTLESSTNTFQQHYNENVVSIGGTLSKQKGNFLHYNVTGEFAILGEDQGQVELDANMDINFKLFKKELQLLAHSSISHKKAGFYFRHYHSNNSWWNNNDLSNESRVRIDGTLSYDKGDALVKVGVENITDYTYFANTDQAYVVGENTSYLKEVSVKQAAENIQVFSATLKKNFKFGILHLDNSVTYQTSSNQTIIPLPKINLYHNLYISTKLSKKVLSLELGVDVRYFSKYYAPNYSPSLQQYSLQDTKNRIEIGNYPLVNLYANLHLKRTRFYVMFYHVNAGSGNLNSFLVPHNPINPRMFKFGLSWNFFD